MGIGRRYVMHMLFVTVVVLLLVVTIEICDSQEYNDEHSIHTIRTKRGFGSLQYDGDTGYGGGVSASGYGHIGGAAGLAQQAANQAKSAQAAQGPAAHQASQQARAILAAQASQLAQQALAVVTAKQAQVAQIAQAANAAQAAAFSEATQTAKSRSAVYAAQASKYIAISTGHHYGSGRRQIYAAQVALREAQNVAAWQAQMSYQAQQNSIALSNKLIEAYGDLAKAQSAANKATRASSIAQSSISSYYY